MSKRTPGRTAAELERYANDPAYRAKTLARNNARHRERYATDPEYRAKCLAARAATRRERYANDPEYRAKYLAKRAASRRARYANEPEYRAKCNAAQRARRAAKKAARRVLTCEHEGGSWVKEGFSVGDVVISYDGGGAPLRGTVVSITDQVMIVDTTEAQHVER